MLISPQPQVPVGLGHPSPRPAACQVLVHAAGIVAGKVPSARAEGTALIERAVRGPVDFSHANEAQGVGYSADRTQELPMRSGPMSCACFPNSTISCTVVDMSHRILA